MGTFKSHELHPISLVEVVIRERGRIVLPVEIRRALCLREGDRLQVSIKDGAIVLRPLRHTRLLALRGVLRGEKVRLEEIETALASEVERELRLSRKTSPVRRR